MCAVCVCGQRSGRKGRLGCGIFWFSGMGWDHRFPVIRTFPARDMSMAQSQLTKLSGGKGCEYIPRLFIKWLNSLFNRFARHDTDFLTDEHRKIYIDEGLLRIPDDLRWLTFDELLALLRQQVQQKNQNLPAPLHSQPRSFITWRVPSTQEILPLFPPYPSSIHSSSSFKNSLQQNLKNAQQLENELSQNCDKDICDRVGRLMLESETKRSHSLEESDDEGMDVIGSSLPQKLLSCRRKPLSIEEEAAVDSALSPPYDHSVICEKFKIPMTRSNISCLRPVTWLNDEVINFYLEMLAERDTLLSENSKTGRRTSHYFNTFFISKLLERGEFTYSNVRRWTRKIDLFEKDKVFFPINISNTHWTIAVAFVQERRVVYYDSMGGVGDSYTRAIVDYFVQEASDKKKGLELTSADWTREAAIRTLAVLPQQHNGSDCGMFTLMFADFISDNLDLSGFTQSDIKDYRRKVAAAILRGSLNYDMY